jgi:alkanesulfonate monooxygenase SsuD/methylene tetrahydromethanopterin reductase-like flavin-dependent oxidoreductase (luciferase family)
MARVAGRIADGVRPHPICTRRHIEETLVPATQQGAADAGRPAGDIEVCASPLIATAPDEAGVAERVSDVRARIAFYASTRTYRAVFETHGWDDVADRLSVLSREGRWDEMEQHVTDEMVDTIAVVGTHDEIAERVWRRYEGVCDRVEFSIPVHGPADGERLAAMVSEIRTGF